MLILDLMPQMYMAEKAEDTKTTLKAFIPDTNGMKRLMLKDIGIRKQGNHMAKH